jgi:hypothetical protein
MVWKSERKRSITFRKRPQREEALAWSMQPYRETGPQVMTCMALVMPAQYGSGLDRVHNWVVLLSNDFRGRAYEAVLEGTQRRSNGVVDDSDQTDE